MSYQANEWTGKIVRDDGTGLLSVGPPMTYLTTDQVFSLINGGLPAYPAKLRCGYCDRLFHGDTETCNGCGAPRS